MGQVGQWSGNNGADNDKTVHAFGSTFAFFPTAQSQQKKCKRATKPTHHDNPTDEQRLKRRAADNKQFGVMAG